VERIDPEYFRYQVEVHGRPLLEDESHQAATAIRAAYLLGVETLFTVLFAGTQAPAAPMAWILHCRTKDLRRLVRDVGVGSRVPNPHGMEAVDWAGLSEVFNGVYYEDEAKVGRTQEAYATLWRRLATDFLDPHAIAEYNSLKHGFRVAAGGFSMRMGREHTEGEPPPASEMHSMGGSKWGSTFYTSERIAEKGVENSAHHFDLRRHHLNWNPIQLAQRLDLITMSLTNVLSTIKSWYGVDSTQCQFVRPVEDGDFDTPWVGVGGSIHFSFHTTVRPQEVVLSTKKELNERLEAYYEAVREGIAAEADEGDDQAPDQGAS